MLIRELLTKTNPYLKLEISHPKYFYGYPLEVPEELLDLEVSYIAAGPSDTDGTNNTLLIDAFEEGELDD